MWEGTQYHGDHIDEFTKQNCSMPNQVEPFEAHPPKVIHPKCVVNISSRATPEAIKSD